MRGVNDLSMMMKFVMCLGWYMLSGQGQQDRGEQVLQANNALGQWMKAQSMDEGQRRYKPPIPAEAEQATTTFRQLKQKCMMCRCLVDGDQLGRIEQAPTTGIHITYVF